MDDDIVNFGTDSGTSGNENYVRKSDPINVQGYKRRGFGRRSDPPTPRAKYM